MHANLDAAEAVITAARARHLDHDAVAILFGRDFHVVHEPLLHGAPLDFDFDLVAVP